MRNATLLALLLTGCLDSGVGFDDTDGLTGTNTGLGNTAGNTTNNGSNTNTGNTGGDDPFGMVAAHNVVRSGIQPTPGTGLPMMSWDPALADVAKAWAERCDFNHSNNQYGENLYVSTSANEGTRAVESWASEVEDYDYDANQCRDVCGHYTQIVWRDSTKVGCGFADCDVLTGVGSFSSGRLWVCNYDPPGNWVGEWPY